MFKSKKKLWSGSIIVLIALLNITALITVFNEDQKLFWILLVPLPLLAFSVYNESRTKHRVGKRNGDNMRSLKKTQFELLSHSTYPSMPSQPDMKVLIGNDQCNQPYQASIFNIDSPVNAKKKNSFNHSIEERNYEDPACSGEEELSTYPLMTGGVVWQIAPGYTGCRTQTGSFNSKAFKQNARRADVKMIELKLSPAIKRTCPGDSALDIAQQGDSRIDNSIFPGSGFTNFRDTEGMMYFLLSMRKLSGGKPIGIRLCINDKKEFYKICYTIRKTQIIPDFIVVEGFFENTGIANPGQAFNIGMPLYEALLFVSQTLQAYSLESEIKIIASGRITSCIDVLKVLALGANAVCTDMPGYFSIRNQEAGEFHDNLLKSMIHVMKICGFMNVDDITLSKFFRRLDILHAINFERLDGPSLRPAALRKVYQSKIRSFQPRKERKKERLNAPLGR